MMMSVGFERKFCQHQKEIKRNSFQINLIKVHKLLKIIFYLVT